MKTLKTQLFLLPTPTTISIWWNIGSLLGIILLFQILTGLFLSFHYINDFNMAFYSVNHILRDINNGWLMKILHSNGASLFFIFMYIHMFRGLFYQSFMKKTWFVGVTILLTSMLTAFLGYVLPWGQMSYWGTTVITNLISSLPYIGPSMVIWLWGGPSVSGPTLNRFFSLHFIMPFLILILMLIHLILLHSTGSSKPTSTLNKKDMTSFHNLFSYKDMFTLITFALIFTLFLIYPNTFNDPENYNISSNVKTPTHIQPEWYFLFAYTILRSVPNKLGGVCALIFSILIFYIMPILKEKKPFQTQNPINKFLFMSLLFTMIMLTWIGMKPVMYPYDILGKLFSLTYFSTIFLISMKKYL